VPRRWEIILDIWEVILDIRKVFALGRGESFYNACVCVSTKIR
jgi:hypothetical protein